MFWIYIAVSYAVMFVGLSAVVRYDENNNCSHDKVEWATEVIMWVASPITLPSTVVFYALLVFIGVLLRLSKVVTPALCAAGNFLNWLWE